MSIPGVMHGMESLTELEFLVQLSKESQKFKHFKGFFKW